MPSNPLRKLGIPFRHTDDPEKPALTERIEHILRIPKDWILQRRLGMRLDDLTRRMLSDTRYGAEEYLSMLRTHWIGSKSRTLTFVDCPPIIGLTYVGAGQFIETGDDFDYWGWALEGSWPNTQAIEWEMGHVVAMRCESEVDAIAAASVLSDAMRAGYAKFDAAYDFGLSPVSSWLGTPAYRSFGFGRIERGDLGTDPIAGFHWFPGGVDAQFDYQTWIPDQSQHWIVTGINIKSMNHNVEFRPAVQVWGPRTITLYQEEE